MATASEPDLTGGTTQWSRASFSKSFKRKGRKSKNSDTQSIASSGVGGSRGSDAGTPFDSPVLRRNSTDSSRKLSLRLGGRKRSAVGLGKTNSNEALSRVTTEEPLAGEEDSSNYYTEEEEEKAERPTLASRNSHIGYLTASSPLITTETVDSAPPNRFESAPSGSSTRSSSRSNTLKAPASIQRRSPSPVGRLKDAFKSRRSGTSPAASEGKREEEKATENSQADEGRGRKNSLGPTVLKDRQLVEEPGEKTPSPQKARSTPRTLVTKFPATPPSFDGPATVVTPPTPTDPSHSRNQSTSSAAESIKPPESAYTAQPGPNSAGVRTQGIAHRRIKSAGQPSKLSNAISAPLTPALEEIRTPGGTVTAPTAATGFFSSMFSAAQSAANSLTNTIAAGGQTRPRSGTDPKVGRAGGEEVILHPGSEEKEVASPGDRKQLAIETLGSGNLSLSHLGISENSDVSPMNSSTELVSGIRRDEMAAKAEDDAAARAVSMAYTEKTDGDRVRSATPSVVDTTEQTPVQPLVEQDISGIRRAGSVRSRLSGRRRGRTRGSSAATGQTMAPSISGPGSTIHKLPGFSVAPNKRQKDFHNLFRSVPDDDYLIEDYSAALQRDILLQGRMYISEGHICFSSNILGWVTNLVMSFDEIISVEKKATAMIFQNGIIIQTLQAKNVFASLLNRDTTYDLIISIWKITHPNLRSTLNGAPVEGIGSGDKTEKVGTQIEEESSAEEIYDEDEEEDDQDEEGDGSFAEPNEESIAASETGDTARASKRLSSNPLVTPVQNGTAKMTEAVESVLTGATATLDFPGPSTHAPTECGDSGSHLEKPLMEDTIPAPLGKIYSLMFGPASGKFMRKWLVEDQKSMDLQLEDDGKGLDNDHKSMTFSYIKPLSGPIGPKQTKCIINQTLEQFDLNKAVTVSCSTQNPDVPSGNIFVVKTRYCLSWGPNNSTKFLATCQIEWSGKSWLKGPIEKGANDGQLQYQKDIVAALKGAVTAKSALKAGTKGKGRGGKRKKDSADAVGDASNATASNAAAKAPEKNWGLFEPLRGPLGPIADLIHPSFFVAFLLLTIFVLWWRLSAVRTSTGGVVPHAQRYEEMWRQEESELWRWLEDRAGLDGAVPGFLRDENAERTKWLEKQRVREMGKRLDGSEMQERQMKEALRVTRERLEALEVAVKARVKV